MTPAFAGTDDTAGSSFYPSVQMLHVTQLHLIEFEVAKMKYDIPQLSCFQFSAVNHGCSLRGNAV